MIHQSLEIIVTCKEVFLAHVKWFKVNEGRAFYNVYQPLMSSKSGEIYAYEALLRTTSFINQNLSC